MGVTTFSVMVFAACLVCCFYQVHSRCGHAQDSHGASWKEITYSQVALQDGDEATMHAISDNRRLRKRQRNKTM